ncbi:MAG: hypothetical protein ACI37T_03410 [Candidatus Gastranaerophilaceae bacterium]
MKEKDYFVLYTPDDMLKAYELLSENFSKNEIFEVLNSSDDIKKQVCLIKLQSISCQEDADILVSVLTGQHGPVREICSFKINEFLKREEYRCFFSGDKTREILLNGLNDIIPTVARNIIEVIKLVPNQEKIRYEIEKRILSLDEEDIIDDNLSNHEITKKTFKLYWYLEALSEIAQECQDDEMFLKIIQTTYKHEDYTIREKVAKILSCISGFEGIRNELKADVNPYVFSKLNHI